VGELPVFARFEVKQAMLKIEFHDNGQRGLYATELEGHRAKLTFVHEGPDVIRVDKTYVPPEIEGRGVAAALVERAVADARAKGWKIVPECSYVAAAFRRHTDWADVLAVGA
jgi:predicted GNAT family acetyltransferase